MRRSAADLIGQLRRGWRRKPVPRGFALGLQGGGALGAFTWGVLDRLLESDDFACAAASGASAGAMNAVVMAAGLVQGGPARARELLGEFWQRVGRQESALPGPGFAALLGQWRTRWLWSAASVSPYVFNPLGHNPLREVLDELVDFSLLRRPEAPRLFVSATDVTAGKARIFDNDELSVDAVLASACLPQLFHAVEIEGRPYWDGGFTANPAAAPLRDFAAGHRVLFVILNPVTTPDLPRTAPGIADRLNQIVGNAALMRELDAFGAHERIELGHYAPLASQGDKLNNARGFLQHLHGLGRKATADWLAGRTPAAAAE
ncbi:MAG: patatin-like phospholipase family protein [Rhodospirillaceae bacterium]|nr:patatin-like phospholipase family protein [Rhodospirillaceae bacterium]